MFLVTVAITEPSQSWASGRGSVPIKQGMQVRSLAGELKLHMLHGSRKKKIYDFGSSLPVQWLRLHTSNAEGAGLIPGQGTQIPHASRSSQKKKKKVTNPGDLNPTRGWRLEFPTHRLEDSL